MNARSLARWRQMAAFDLDQRLQPAQARPLGKWLYVLAMLAAVVWTLMMWGAYGLLSLSDEAVHSASAWLGVDAQLLQQASSLIGGAQQWGEAIVLIVWAIGIALVALAGWLGRSLIRAITRSAPAAG